MNPLAQRTYEIIYPRFRMTTGLHPHIKIRKFIINLLIMESLFDNMN